MPKLIDFQAISVFKNNIMDLINQKLSPTQNNAYKILFSSTIPQNVNPGEIVMVYENANGTNKKISSIWISGDDIEEPEPIIEEPGLYDADGVMLASWDELVNDYGLDADTNLELYQTTTLCSIMQNNENLSTGVSLIIGNVDSIGDYAFRSSLITSVKIPSSVTSIGKYAFGSSLITSVEIPSSVTSIGESAFLSCSALTSVRILGNIATMGSFVFSDCSSLKNVEITDGVKIIGNSAFYNDPSLTSVKIPSSVTSIGKSAFSVDLQTLSSLKNVEILDGVVCLEGGTFCNCKQLKTIYIPESVTTISGQPFKGCSSSLKIYCGASAAQSGWEYKYEYYSNSSKLSVTFGVTREEYETTYKT